MNSKAEEIFERVNKYQHWSFLAMSIIVAYHIVTPRSLGGIILSIILFFPILIYSQNLFARIISLK
jgi:hypothetical protein